MTYTPEEGAQIFKRDPMGRVRLPRERREELLDEFERSGMSGVQFGEDFGPTFHFPVFARSYDLLRVNI
jgi:hypothetical protein